MKNFTLDQLNKIFHSDDVRGLSPSQMDADFFELLGKAMAVFLNAKKIVVGHDMRVDSKVYYESVVKGIASQGVEVMRLGEIGTEMIYFATGNFQDLDAGIIITASHNPTGWNGAKMVSRGAVPISARTGLDDIKNLVAENAFIDSETPGEINDYDLYPEYKQKVRSFLGDADLCKFKIVVDAGNGIGGKLFDYVYGDLDLNVEKMYFEPDGSFPNHVPNPMEEENVADLKKKTIELNADLGIAIDADADRAAFSDRKGRVPNGAYSGPIMAKYFLQQREGVGIVHDLRVVGPVLYEIEKYKGISNPCKVGHSHLKEMMKKTDSDFGTEAASHFYFKDYYYADSGMISIAIMLRLLSTGMDFENELDYYYTHFPTSGEVNFEVEDVPGTLERIKTNFQGEINEMDGLAIDMGDSRFLVRSSSREPVLRVNVEGKSREKVVETFRKLETIISGRRVNMPALEELQ